MSHAAVEDAPGPAPGKRPMGTGDKIRFALRGVGQTLITLGLVVLLFVVYEVWITNIAADRNNHRNIAALHKEVDTVLGLPGDANSTIPVGKSLGVLYMPRLGRDYAEAIVQGSTVPDDSQLEQGTAHYGNTQLPGQKGNFAVAGHRVGKGEPFLNIDKLRSGDAVVVEAIATDPATKKKAVAWYVYRVMGIADGTNTDPQTDKPDSVQVAGQNPVSLPGRQIIEPSDGDVLRPIPNHPDIPVSSAVDKLMTMTTCHPKFTASHRMIVYSRLAQTVYVDDKADANTMPAAISALYNEVSA
jgi:sortase A